MAYSVNNIIGVNTNLQPTGLTFANFSSIFAFAVQADLEGGATFPVDTYKDYATLDEVGEDFTSSSPPYLMARRWFAQTPRPEQFSVWMWDDDASTGDSPAEVAAKANDEAWRYFYAFPNSVADTEADVTALADWADSNGHYTGFTLVGDADVVDPNSSSDLASALQSAGNRHISIGYRKTATVNDDASQAYAHVQTFAAFQKFNPDGVNTAITAEYQVLSGVVGEDLTTTEYNALVDKNVIFWTEIELQGSTDESRTINSKSMSSFGEFMDDVVNIDVLSNRVKVNAYNYIANAGTKRPYTPRGYAGLLSAIEDTMKGFYDNGVLGRATYTDPTSGDDVEAKYGFAILSEPEDVLDATNSQRSNREYPDVTALAILARAGHTASLTINVE